MYAAITPSSSGICDQNNLTVSPSSQSPHHIILQPKSTSLTTWRSGSAFTVSASSPSAVAYFEITAKKWATIGICRRNYSINGFQPGWKTGSAAFHGNDGLLYIGRETGNHYSAPWQKGDRIGCGVKLRSGVVFFTVNGKNIGAATVASAGLWHFCIGFQNDLRQVVIVHFSPADWKIDPFVKIGVLVCKDCLDVNFPGCGKHSRLLTNFTDDDRIAQCSGPQCVDTKRHWKNCKSCATGGYVCRPLCIRDGEVKLLANAMQHQNSDAVRMECLICQGCKVLEFSSISGKLITQNKDSATLQKKIGAFQHYGRCPCKPLSLRLRISKAEAIYIRDYFPATLNSIGPHVHGASIPQPHNLLGSMTLAENNKDEEDYDEDRAKLYFLQSIGGLYPQFRYRITRVRKVSNPTLRTSFHAFRSKLLQQGRDGTVKQAFHSTLSKNVKSICKSNLTMKHKGETDAGWFGSGLYFSAYPDYTFCYNHKPPRPLQEGDKGSVILFDVCLGMVKKLIGLDVGGTLTPGYNSHKSPKGCEWVIFDQNQCSPRFILDFVVERLPLKKMLGDKIWEDGKVTK